MNDTIESFFKNIESKGGRVQFSITHPMPWGGTTIGLSLQEMIDYAADPDGFVAAYYGISKTEYLGWIDSGFSVRCCAKTTKGKQCKGLVAWNVEDPRAWAKAAAAGGYCWTHSEKNT